MKCNKCLNRMVLCAFDNGKCKYCKKELFSANIPCETVCIECSTKENKCEQCNKDL